VFLKDLKGKNNENVMKRVYEMAQRLTEKQHEIEEMKKKIAKSGEIMQFLEKDSKESKSLLEKSNSP